MTEQEVIRHMREHLESQFPKSCPNCHRCYETLREYIIATGRVEPAICYDAELEDWTPEVPVGTATYSNCPCGTTLALTSHGMPILRLWSLYNWARVEKKKRGISMAELLTYLRNKIRAEVMARGE